MSSMLCRPSHRPFYQAYFQKYSFRLVSVCRTFCNNCYFLVFILISAMVWISWIRNHFSCERKTASSFYLSLFALRKEFTYFFQLTYQFITLVTRIVAVHIVGHCFQLAESIPLSRLSHPHNAIKLNATRLLSTKITKKTL